MPRLRVRIELNRGGVGVPLHKLASVVQESQRFFEMLAQDVHIDKDRGEWLGFDFDNESLNFTAEYVGPVTSEQVAAFGAAFDGVTSMRRATIGQFTRIAEAIGEDELIGFGLYPADHDGEPNEWRCLSKRDALRIAEEIHLLLGASGESDLGSHLPAVADVRTGARIFKDRYERGLVNSTPKLPELIREVESNLTKRIGRIEGELDSHSHAIKDLRETSASTEESFRGLLSAVENFCGQATRQLERLAPAAERLAMAEQVMPAQAQLPAPSAESTEAEPLAAVAEVALPEAKEPEPIAEKSEPAVTEHKATEPVAAAAAEATKTPVEAAAPERSTAGPAPEARPLSVPKPVPAPEPVAAPLSAPSVASAPKPATSPTSAPATTPAVKPATAPGPTLKPISKPVPPPKPAPRPAEPAELHWRTVGVAASILVGLTAAAFFLWPSRTGEPHSAQAASGAAAPVIETSRPVPAEPRAVVSDASSAPVKSPRANAKPAPAETAAVVPAVSETPKADERASATAPAAAGPLAEPMHVELEAHELVWVTMTDAEGKTIMARTLQPGETRSLDLAADTVLRTGNAGGLTVRFNGQDVGALGPSGKVRDVRFQSGAFKVVAPRDGN